MTKPAIEMHADGTPNAREWQSGCDVTFISEPIKIVLPKMKRAIQCSLTTVEPLNKGHLGTQAAVPYSEVVPYWEVRDKTVILCTFTASMMYKTHYGVIK